MKKSECAVIMAYTWTCMLQGEDFCIFHEYIEKLMGRPVMTHELASKCIENRIKELAKDDFIRLCEGATDD